MSAPQFGSVAGVGLGLLGWRIGARLGGRFTAHALYRKGVQRESRREEARGDKQVKNPVVAFLGFLRLALSPLLPDGNGRGLLR